MRAATTYIGIDDTDMPDVSGTGKVARDVASRLPAGAVVGVTRHQLLVDPRVPCTRRNSCKVIHLAVAFDAGGLASKVAPWIAERSIPGSDPGLCILDASAPAHDFGRRTQTELLTQEDARRAARDVGALLVALGGTGDGVIGALAGALLAATGEDGRFIDYACCRSACGLRAVEEILSWGVDSVRGPGGREIRDGLVAIPARGIRPLLRGGAAVLRVEEGPEGGWVPTSDPEGGKGVDGGRRWK